MSVRLGRLDTEGVLNFEFLVRDTLHEIQDTNLIDGLENFG